MAFVYLTRDTDIDLSINNRYTLANAKNANCFASIHINASTSSEKVVQQYFQIITTY